MSIPVVCSCGQRYSAKDSLAGKTLKCRKCGAPLTVPAVTKGDEVEYSLAPAEEAAATETGPVMSCPGCQAEMPMEAVFCVKCGYHQTLGKKLKTQVEEVSTRPAGAQPTRRGRRRPQRMLVSYIVGAVVIGWIVIGGPRSLLGNRLGAFITFAAVVAVFIVLSQMEGQGRRQGGGSGSGCGSGGCGSGDGGGGCGGAVAVAVAAAVTAGATADNGVR